MNVDMKNTDVFWINTAAHDFPFVRWFIKKNSHMFNKFFFIFNYLSEYRGYRKVGNNDFYTESHFDYVNKIKDDLSNYNVEFVFINTQYSSRDWRDQCFNEFLYRSNSKYILHLDPDQYIDNSFFENIHKKTYIDFNVLCPVWGNRIWPFLWTRRELLDKTTRDFTSSTIRVEFNREIFIKTGDLKSSCVKDISNKGDHGDKLIFELLELTDYTNWMFYPEDIECIHYTTRTCYHDFIFDFMRYGKLECHPALDLTSRNSFISTLKSSHLEYLNKISSLDINLFDTYKKEREFFIDNYDVL